MKWSSVFNTFFGSDAYYAITEKTLFGFYFQTILNFDTFSQNICFLFIKKLSIQVFKISFSDVENVVASLILIHSGMNGKWINEKCEIAVSFQGGAFYLFIADFFAT